MGYITGVCDASKYFLSLESSIWNRNITLGQLCAIVAKYLKAHPEKWDYSAESIILEALIEAFPKESE